MEIGGIAAKKYHAGKDGEEIPPQRACQVSQHKPMLFVTENPGKPQSPKTKYVICEKLGNADNIRVHHKLQYPIGHCCHKPAPQAEKIAHQADKKHTAKGHAPSHRHICQLYHTGCHGQGYGHGRKHQLLCTDLPFPSPAAYHAASQQKDYQGCHKPAIAGSGKFIVDSPLLANHFFYKKRHKKTSLYYHRRRTLISQAFGLAGAPKGVLIQPRPDIPASAATQGFCPLPHQGTAIWLLPKIICL
ncbi:hypothetical protein IMSAGC019_03019 [Lachnospiraceae bacterium]|nr:hypothetical protein IMSAGC019_03019 [Lachnospiraceae bacterium]